jgi:curved DNA-binding protein CbpA
MAKDAREPDHGAGDRAARDHGAADRAARDHGAGDRGARDHGAGDRAARDHTAQDHAGPNRSAPDHYAALGVPVDASQSEIAHAFRQQARIWHPDARPDDMEAPARFRAIVDAYRALADPRRRARYDRDGKAGRDPAGQGPPAQPPTRSGRGRPVRVRFVNSAGSAGAAGAAWSTEGSPHISPVDPRQRWDASRHVSPVDPRQPGDRGPRITPPRRGDAFPDDPLRDLIGRLRALLYGRW